MDIIVNIIFVSVVGMMISFSIGWYIRGIFGVDLIINGILVGLVVIIVSCYVVIIFFVVVIGVIGVIVIILVE